MIKDSLYEAAAEILQEARKPKVEISDPVEGAEDAVGLSHLFDRAHDMHRELMEQAPNSQGWHSRLSSMHNVLANYFDAIGHKSLAKAHMDHHRHHLHLASGKRKNK